jgi:tripartite-type tricarboxylate transporter receptor subunit TctC
MFDISGITSVLRLSVLGLLWLACAMPAGFAQSYPNKTIHFIMPYPVGGSIDIAGRMVIQKLAENLGQQIVVDNRTGAGGIVGTEMAARAAADGYTLVMGGNGTLALSPHLQRHLPYDPVRDFAPITQLVIVPYVLVVNPALKANSVGELIALAKSRPGEINYASGGNGSAPHLAAELFKRMADVRLLHVPYKGSTPGINDVISGQVQLTFTGIPSVLSQIKSGRLRPLAVTSAKRAAALPNVPTIGESGVPGYEVSPWFGVLVPARTPPALVTRLNSEIVKVLRSPAIRERFAAEGVEPVGNTPAQFAAHIKLELAKWGKVLEDAGIRAD